MPDFQSPSFQGTSLDSPITKVGLPLIAVPHGEESHLWGSACLIAPWLAMTASHVIQAYSREFEGQEAGPGFTERTYHLFTYVLTDHGKKMLQLSVGTVWYNDATDIAFLHLLPAGPISPDHVWECPVLELLPPKVGSHVAAFGYPRSSVSTKAPYNFEVRMDASTTTGTVLKVHDEYRDKSMLKFPCFETNARFDPGMSGGPVFNEHGHVCGIIGAGLDPPVEGGDHYSHASTLWPALGTIVNFPWEDRYPRGTSFPIYEFMKARFIDTRHLDHVSVTVNPDGTQTVTCRRYDL
jgi:trypsin-like peptidase